MALIEGKKFSKIIRRYQCDDEVQRQIREFIMRTMIPDEDVIFNHCIVALADKAKRVFNRQRQTRYFHVVFYVMYYQIGQEFVGEPVLEITYDAAWELTKDDYKSKMTEQVKERTILTEAKEIINPTYRTKYAE